METTAQQGCALGLRTEDLKLLFHAKLECPAEEVVMLPPLFFFFLIPFLLRKKQGKVCGRIVFADLVQSTVTNESWRSMTRHVNLS